ncbi:hypothetical protein UFOVP1624_42 [uncultured Caudovirales phage]|uniref:Uncharacterized protein n=1 Tax=uncultured Caudovirales phage TaxID=2100421 RepID=A0A6J5SYH4_9CAUD|nr:hypothetical protein UFOVP1624_42 [uncultured Caudovirales phage]
MGFFSSLTKLALDVVVTPIAIVKDVVTLGGELTDEKGSYTGRKIDDIENDFDELKDSLDD